MYRSNGTVTISTGASVSLIPLPFSIYSRIVNEVNSIRQGQQELMTRFCKIPLLLFLASQAYTQSSVGIPAKANTDSSGNANGIPGRGRTVVGA
jgi:hypothetical protein